MKYAHVSKIADNLETALLDAKDRGGLSPHTRYWLFKVLQEQLDIPVRTIMPGCTTMESCAVSNHMEADTVKIVRERLEYEKLPQDKIEKVCKLLRKHLDSDMWKRIDILLNDAKSYDISDYRADGACHMVVLVPFYNDQEPIYLVLDEYHNRDGWMVRAVA